MKSKSKWIAATTAVLLLSLSTNVLACESANIHTYWTGDVAGLEVNEFAFILRDAQVNACADTARIRLTSKLDSMTSATWKGTWMGAIVSFSLATGLILGGNGHLTDDLDTKLTKAANDYALTLQGGCGFTASTWQNGNTCLEDHAIAAMGHGWRTAWYRLTARAWSGDRSMALNDIRMTLSDGINCIYNKTQGLDPNRGVCNSNLAALQADTTGNIEMMTLNHGYQIPAYGVGMLTHVATAYVGLEVAYEKVTSVNVSQSYRNMATQLYREGNAKATSSGAFGQNCRQLTGTALTDPPTTGCWDPQGGKTQATGYRADMFPVAAWMDAYNIPRTLAPGQPLIWPFVTFNASTFSDPNGMWGAGRKTGYYTMANQWLASVGNKPPFHSNGSYRVGIKRTQYWYVVNTGTGTPTATSGVRDVNTPQATFTIRDLNSGDLMNGDPVAIRNKDGFYWQATNGGGSTVTAPSQGIPANAVFTIEKMGPTEIGDPIAHTDFFALRAPNGVHYLTAPTGGAVSATATSFGLTERFTLERLHTD
jgi:hypothetical protein